MTGHPSEEALKRVTAGRYRTADGRFTVEQASGRWLVVDDEQVDELGLPLTRGPFGTLDAARAAIAEARSGPAPRSTLPRRIGSSRSGASRGPKVGRSGRPSPQSPGAPAQRAESRRPPRPGIRTYRAGEGARLRAFWDAVELRSLGDDDASLDRVAERNPGLVLIAEADDRIVGTVVGAWDGRRGWMYHVAVAPDVRRTGVGRRMVHEVERRLRSLGCPKVNVIVTDENHDGRRFWEALGYTTLAARQFGRQL